jgi:hypothetical protein
MAALVPAGRFASRGTSRLTGSAELVCSRTEPLERRARYAPRKGLSTEKRTHDGSRSLIRVVEASRGQPEGIEIAMVA